MTGVHWNLDGQQMLILPGWHVSDQDQALAWTAVPLAGRMQLRCHMARGRGFVQALRHVLMKGDDMDICRMTDPEVIDHVVEALLQGSLSLHARTAKLPTPTRHRMAVALRGGDAQASQAASPSSMGPSRAEKDAASDAPAAPREALEWAAADQNAQAKTLRLAAVDGVPFCEVCQRLAQGLAEDPGKTLSHNAPLAKAA